MQEMLDHIDRRLTFHGLGVEKLTNKQFEKIMDRITEIVNTAVINHEEYDNFIPTWVNCREDWDFRLKDSGKLPHVDKHVDFMVESLSVPIKLKVRHVLNKGPCYWGYESNSNLELGDLVHMPFIGRFIESKYYYKTLFHEFGHACCSVDRLKIKMEDAEEEICVEIVALFLCIVYGLNIWDDAIKYIINWSYENRDEQKRPLYKTKTEWRRINNNAKNIIRYMFTGKKKHKGTIHFNVG